MSITEEKVEALEGSENQTLGEQQSSPRKPSPDEVGSLYAELLKEYFKCDVRYVRNADMYEDDDFYQLEFETSEPFENIEAIEEEVNKGVGDVINLAKYGQNTFQATIWLAPKKK